MSVCFFALDFDYNNMYVCLIFLYKLNYAAVTFMYASLCILVQLCMKVVSAGSDFTKMSSLRRRGWDDLREQHRNVYIINCETDLQSRLDA